MTNDPQKPIDEFDKMAADTIIGGHCHVDRIAKALRKLGQERDKHIDEAFDSLCAKNRALNERDELKQKLSIALEALEKAKQGIIETATDTIWCNHEAQPHCTVVDIIDWALKKIGEVE